MLICILNQLYSIYNIYLTNIYMNDINYAFAKCMLNIWCTYKPNMHLQYIYVTVLTYLGIMGTSSEKLTLRMLLNKQSNKLVYNDVEWIVYKVNYRQTQTITIYILLIYYYSLNYQLCYEYRKGPI